MRPAAVARCVCALIVSVVALLAITCSSGSKKDEAGGVAGDTNIDAPPAAEAPPSPTPEPVTKLLFTGDLIPARCTYAKLQALGGDYTAPFKPLHDMLNAADITIGTLDATMSDAGTPFGCTPTFSLMAPAAAVAGLKYAGYDVIAHAANHIKDCGQGACGDRAMFETHENLLTAGIKPVGDGATMEEARRPVVVERNGMYFAFLAYDDIADYYHATATRAGSAPLDPATIAEDVANARKVANVVIIIPHWGVEYTAEPSARQREFTRAAAAAGADMIVGNHPHWVQAHEQIGRMFCAYALGNFVFDQDWSLETQQGALLEVTFTGTRVTATHYTPVHIYDQYQPRLAGPAEAASIMSRIEAASAALTTP